MIAPAKRVEQGTRLNPNCVVVLVSNGNGQMYTEDFDLWGKCVISFTDPDFAHEWSTITIPALYGKLDYLLLAIDKSDLTQICRENQTGLFVDFRSVLPEAQEVNHG